MKKKLLISVEQIVESKANPKRNKQEFAIDKRRTTQYRRAQGLRGKKN